MTAGTYRWISILEGSTHHWLRMKQEAVDCGPEDWICMAPRSLLAAISLLSAELIPPAPLVTSPPPRLACVSVWFPLASSLSLCSQFLSTSPLCTKQLSSKQGTSQTPLPAPLLQSPRISKNPSLFKCALSASQQARERMSYPDSQPVVLFSWQLQNPANAHGSVLAFCRRGSSRSIQATGSCSNTTHSSALWTPQQRLLERKSPWWCRTAWHVSAQEGSSRGVCVCGWVGARVSNSNPFPSVVQRSHFSFSCLPPSATSISYLLSLTWALPLWSACGSLSFLLALLLSVTVHALVLSLYFWLAKNPANSSVTHSENECECAEESSDGWAARINDAWWEGNRDLSSIPQHLTNALTRS